MKAFKYSTYLVCTVFWNQHWRHNVMGCFERHSSQNFEKFFIFDCKRYWIKSWTFFSFIYIVLLVFFYYGDCNIYQASDTCCSRGFLLVHSKIGEALKLKESTECVPSSVFPHHLLGNTSAKYRVLWEIFISCLCKLFSTNILQNEGRPKKFNIFRT